MPERSAYERFSQLPREERIRIMQATAFKGGLNAPLAQTREEARVCIATPARTADAPAEGTGEG